MAYFEDEVEVEVGGESVAVMVEYTVTGGFHEATWGYDGGHPAEGPEVEVVDLYLSENNEKTLVFDQVFFLPSADNTVDLAGRVNYYRWEDRMIEKFRDYILDNREWDDG